MKGESQQRRGRKLVKEVIDEYLTHDVYNLVSSKIKENNYIEAYAITDQYVEESISKLLILKKGELSKIREHIHLSSTLDLMMRLGLVEEFDSDYLEKIKKFKKIRNQLIHNSIHAKPIKRNKELITLPKYIIMRTDLFYFDSLISLIRVDPRILGSDKRDRKEYINKWFQKNEERIRYLLSFLLNLHFVSMKKSNHLEKKELTGDFSTYLTRVFAEIFPFVGEDKLGVSRNYKQFVDYTSSLIVREHGFEEKAGV